MVNKLITLFKIGRKLALSDALNIISKIYKIPVLIKRCDSVFGLGFSLYIENKLNAEKKNIKLIIIPNKPNRFNK